MRKRRVILCGRSLFIDGMETYLRGQRDMSVIKLDQPFASASLSVSALDPNVIVFEKNDVDPAECHRASQLLRDCPGTLILGFDSHSNQVTLYSSQRKLVKNSYDLIRAIREGCLLVHERKKGKRSMIRKGGDSRKGKSEKVLSASSNDSKRRKK